MYVSYTQQKVIYFITFNKRIYERQNFVLNFNNFIFFKTLLLAYSWYEINIQINIIILQKIDFKVRFVRKMYYK